MLLVFMQGLLLGRIQPQYTQFEGYGYSDDDEDINVGNEKERLDSVWVFRLDFVGDNTVGSPAYGLLKAV